MTTDGSHGPLPPCRRAMTPGAMVLPQRRNVLSTVVGVRETEPASGAQKDAVNFLGVSRTGEQHSRRRMARSDAGVVLADCRGVDARHYAVGVAAEAAQLLWGQNVDDQ
jgi:hypothetical protein